MAMAMARAGGIGVIHKNMSIDRQAAEVDRVKRSESGMILNPITLSPDGTLREAVALMQEKHEIVAAIFHGFDSSAFHRPPATQRLAVLKGALEHVLAQPDGKKRLLHGGERALPGVRARRPARRGPPCARRCRVLPGRARRPREGDPDGRPAPG